MIPPPDLPLSAPPAATADQRPRGAYPHPGKLSAADERFWSGTYTVSGFDYRRDGLPRFTTSLTRYLIGGKPLPLA